MENSSEFYDRIFTPGNAPERDKSGVTFKGTCEEYIQAYNLLMDVFKRKGDRYFMNGIEIAIVDTPNNRPSVIELKQKSGMSGKAKLRIFGVNKNGGGTIMITKASGSDFVYAKVLALNVISYLLDGLISRSIKSDDIVRMKKNNSIRMSKTVQCDICEDSFVNLQEFRLHITRMHDSAKKEDSCEADDRSVKYAQEVRKQNNVDCLKDKLEEEDNEELKRLEKESWEEKRFTHVNVSVKICEMEIEEVKDDSDMETSYQKRTKFQDEKVLKKQKKIEDEIKREKENDIEKKRKRQLSTEKKKNKKKPKKDKKTKQSVSEEKKRNENIREIDRKYESLFTEAGLKIDEHVLCVVKGDGACGSSCAALNFHSDRTLGAYVRRNINKHITDFWPFYEPFIQFPMIQTAGSEQLPFNNKDEYLEFLQNDPRSAWLWMEHYDMQALSNMYQVPVHTLTTGVQGMDEPKARWTHMKPDERLRDFNQRVGELPDLYLMHQDDNHFDLIVHRSSILVQEENSSKDVGNQEVVHENVERAEEEIVITNLNDKTDGPGYMGWDIDDSNEVMTFKMKLEDLKIEYSKIKEEFVQLKSDFKNMQTKLQHKEEDRINIKKVSTDINKLQEDYKILVKSLQNETFERNKAETTARILRETIEAQNALKVDSNKEEKMEIVEENEEVWIMQTGSKSKRKSKNPRSKCGICDRSFDGKDKMIEHEKIHGSSQSFKCKKCDNKFLELSALTQHEKSHMQNDCQECDQLFGAQCVLDKHTKQHHASNSFPCPECSSNFKLEHELKNHIRENHEMSMDEDQHVKCGYCSKYINIKSELIEHLKEHEQNLTCKECGQTFRSKNDMDKHGKIHQDTQSFKCNMCRKDFKTENELRGHITRDHREQKEKKDQQCKQQVGCDQCGKSFETEELMKEHQVLLHGCKLDFKCEKCEKVYSSMNGLRRHDWRSHRPVSCNICDEVIESRQEIGNHRKNEHNMFRKVSCKFYPECLDGDECFFSHEPASPDDIKSDKPGSFCPKGDSCLDQSCTFSVASHRKINNILCRFQANCIKKECPFIHTTKRKAFLEENVQSRGNL